MKKQRITIRLDEQEQSILSSLSRKENKTESEIMRAALRKYFQESVVQENSYELAQRLGIIGVAKDLPSDLSSNKDYLNGCRVVGCSKRDLNIENS